MLKKCSNKLQLPSPNEVLVFVRSINTHIYTFKQNLQTEENLQTENLQNCNCRNKEGCPLMGQCQERGVIYQATVLSEGQKPENYVGLTAGTFKKRFDHNLEVS